MVCEKIRSFIEENDYAMHNEAFNNDLNCARRQVTEDAPRAASETDENIQGKNKYYYK